MIRDADALDFRSFLLAYEDLVRKVHAGTLELTTWPARRSRSPIPGPSAQFNRSRVLCRGRARSSGSARWPGRRASKRPTLERWPTSESGKCSRSTSTYDHRIIQGAESGLFLKYVAECLTGAHDFYDEIFASLGIPYEPARWARDLNPSANEAESERILKQIRVQELINMYRVRGHLNAHLDPLSSEPPPLHAELDLATYGLTIWDLQRTFVVDGLAGLHEATLEKILAILRDAYCRTTASSTATLWIRRRSDGSKIESRA